MSKKEFPYKIEHHRGQENTGEDSGGTMILWSRLGVVDAQLAPVEIEPVESIDCRLTLLLGAELTESHASGSSGFAVLKDSESDDWSEVWEDASEFVLSGRPGDVAHEDRGAAW